MPFSRSVKMARGTQGLARFMGQQDAAGRRADNEFDVISGIPFGDFLTQPFRVFRVLQYVELFHVHRAVQTARQQKMAVQHGFRLFQHMHYVLFA